MDELVASNLFELARKNFSFMFLILNYNLNTHSSLNIDCGWSPINEQYLLYYGV